MAVGTPASGPSPATSGAGPTRGGPPRRSRSGTRRAGRRASAIRSRKAVARSSLDTSPARIAAPCSSAVRSCSSLMRATLLAAVARRVWSLHAEMAAGAAAPRCLRWADRRPPHGRARALAATPACSRPRHAPHPRREPHDRVHRPHRAAARDRRHRPTRGGASSPSDTARHTSPWFAGRHRVMIGYGCTPRPTTTTTRAAPATRASTTASTWRCRAARRCARPSAASCSTRRRAAPPERRTASARSASAPRPTTC